MLPVAQPDPRQAFQGGGIGVRADIHGLAQITDALDPVEQILAQGAVDIVAAGEVRQERGNLVRRLAQLQCGQQQAAEGVQGPVVVGEGGLLPQPALVGAESPVVLTCHKQEFARDKRVTPVVTPGHKPSRRAFILGMAGGAHTGGAAQKPHTLGVAPAGKRLPRLPQLIGQRVERNPVGVGPGGHGGRQVLHVRQHTADPIINQGAVFHRWCPGRLIEQRQQGTHIPGQLVHGLAHRFGPAGGHRQGDACGEQQCRDSRKGGAGNFWQQGHGGAPGWVSSAV